MVELMIGRIIGLIVSRERYEIKYVLVSYLLLVYY